MANENISAATVSRMPVYLRYLKGEAAKGVAMISSASMAKALGFSAVGIRKDLAIVSSVGGKPRIGFEVSKLISDIERFLGYHGWTDAVIVGAGGLGRAILSYDGFENYGIHVIAGFDVAPEKIGAVSGKPVYPMDRLSEIVKRHGVKAGVLAVPKRAAQEACNVMVEAGIRAILSFTPVYLQVPDTVTVKYEDLAVSLAALCGGLTDEIK